MRVDRSSDGTTIRLDASERELLRLALTRATFEDIPAGSVKDVLDFAHALRAAIEES